MHNTKDDECKSVMRVIKNTNYIRMKRTCNSLTSKVMNISLLCEFHKAIKKTNYIHMKFYRRSILCYFILITVFSCKENTRPREIIIDNSLFKTIIIDPGNFDTKKPASISEIADSAIYIPLQTEDSLLIGEITKLIVWNDRFYIWDRMTETIFCFGSDGKAIHKIQRQGNGPGEYPRISGFTINDKSGDVYIDSDFAQALFRYTKDGHFIEKIPKSLIISSFAVKNEDTIIYYCGRMPNLYFYSSIYPQQYRFVAMVNGDVVQQGLLFKYSDEFTKIPMSSDNFSFYKDTILLIEHLRPDIYMQLTVKISWFPDIE